MDPAVNNFLIDLIKREDIDDVVEFVNTYYCKVNIFFINWSIHKVLTNYTSCT